MKKAKPLLLRKKKSKTMNKMKKEQSGTWERYKQREMVFVSFLLMD